MLLGSPGAEFQVNDLAIKLGMAIAGLLSEICVSRESAMNSRNPHLGKFVIISRTSGNASLLEAIPDSTTPEVTQILSDFLVFEC